MYFNLKKKVGSIILAVALVFGTQTAIPAFAADNFDVIFEVVTDEDSTTLPGEAKVKISIAGVDAGVNTVQANVTFSGELEYKSIDYLQGEVDLPHKYQTATEVSTANATNEIQAAIFSLDEPITFSGKTELFIITFEGDVGDSVMLTLDKDNTFVKIENNKIYAKENVVSEAATATADANEAANAVVKIVMDKVSDFVADADHPITLTITNERTNKSVSSVLSNDDRTGVIPVTFTVSSAVLANDTYTVDLSGNGYKTYKLTGVDFENELKITNAEFVPGDINKDNKIDSADKTLYEQIIAENEYNAAADFNRDGYVDERDNVFSTSDSGNDNEGNDDNSGGSTGDSGTTGGDTTGGTGGGAGGGGSSGGGGAGGGGGSSSSGGSTGGSTGGGAIYPTTPTTPDKTETFTDLENHAWAKDSIYALKEKGIISGVSETVFAPANNIKRGDFILILTRMLSVNNEFTENFADVPESAYYYNAVGSAKAAGIASGDGANFMPEDSITRQDLITLAYRAFLAKGYIEETEDYTVLDAFADKDNISDYAAAPMASMVKAGIIQGSEGNVNPKGNATRAEVAVMCARLCEMMK